MQIIDEKSLANIVGGRPDISNMRSVIAGLEARGRALGLNRPHRLAIYIGQLAVESGGFRYDREVWGPTAAQKRYDTRTDLGNTPERDGDGKKFKGHTAIQITGRANTREFRDWCRTFDPNVPDFVKEPEKMNTDPWEGLGPLWYWETRDLNHYADQGDVEMVTRKINGGLNGYAERLHFYERAALVLLGYAPVGVRHFQDDRGLLVDGIAGPRTRAAMHASLKAMPDLGGMPVADFAPPLSVPSISGVSILDWLRKLFGLR
ncbi:glycoside hydrolase family 19 protein [Oceanicola sp. 22II-s10i]|uniref:glycoside hydrolase family 19 protein n=1 Tax=Oceanicola sp. 22II-s10i TaxID=1317116 RepID=UPI000B52947E|nr:peptidoglycan-binding protein [Oceanicola sp. 22II-s10i]